MYSLNTEETGVIGGDHLTLTKAGCDVSTDVVAMVKREEDPETHVLSEEPSPVEAEEDLGKRSPTDEQTDTGRRTKEVFDRAPVVQPAVQELPKANVPEEETEWAEWVLLGWPSD